MSYKLENSIRLNFFLVLIGSLLLNWVQGFAPQDIIKRFEYKLSFKGPHLMFKDGTIPFWEHGGAAIASNDQIRITPSIRSQKGRVWSKHNMTNDDWEIQVALKINGRGRIGADGMVKFINELIHLNCLLIVFLRLFGILIQWDMKDQYSVQMIIGMV